MKVVLQNTVTQHYLQSKNCRTPHLDAALDFGYFEKAANFAKEHNLADVQFVAALLITGQTLIFPLRPC